MVQPTFDSDSSLERIRKQIESASKVREARSENLDQFRQEMDAQAEESDEADTQG